MKTTSVTRLKNTLSARLKEVTKGETLLITDRNKPVATLQPLRPGEQDAHLDALYSRGVIAPGRKRLRLKTFLSHPKAVSDQGLTEVLLEERDGR